MKVSDHRSQLAEFEPFDAKLAYRIQDLSRDIEEHTLQLAELRRDAPATTAARYQTALQTENENYQSRLQGISASRLAQASEAKLRIDDIARLDEIKQTWQDSNEQLASLKTGIDQTIKRAEQAERARGYVAGS